MGKSRKVMDYYEEGHGDGVIEGFDDGYVSGISEGYANAFDDGLVEGLYREVYQGEGWEWVYKLKPDVSYLGEGLVDPLDFEWVYAKVLKYENTMLAPQTFRDVVR